MKYKIWLHEWLNSYIKTTTKKQTYDRYCQTAQVHILPKLGEYEIDELSPIILQRFINELIVSGNKVTGTGLSTSFVNIIISILKSSLKIAVMLGVKKVYDVDKLHRPKRAPKRVECFTVREQKKIEAAVLRSDKDKLYGIILTLYTGLRIGELLALTWKDVDLTKGLLYVNKSCHDVTYNGHRIKVIDTPKTHSSDRVIPIPKQLLPRLKELKRRAVSDYVIYDDRRVVLIRSYQKFFQGMLEKLNIPHKCFHALRHTFATRAIECGMDVRSLSEILGHKNPTITLNLYTHSLMEHKIEMMNRLGRLL